MGKNDHKHAAPAGGMMATRKQEASKDLFKPASKEVIDGLPKKLKGNCQSENTFSR